MNRALRSALPSLAVGLRSLSPRCSSANCRPRSRFISFAFRSEGISIGDEWYCGPDCFEVAARNHLARLCSGRKLRLESRSARMPMGLTMLSLGYITSEQLKHALGQQRENGGRIGEVLIGLGFVNQAQIAGALASQWGHPVLLLQNRQLHLPQVIPTRLMEIYFMLPIHFVSQTNTLVIGSAEVVEHRILSTIERMLGCTVVPCFITRDEFDSQSQSVRMQAGNEEVVFDQAASVQEIARITHSYACQIGAMSAKFGMCGDYVWIRLQGPQGGVDILSRIKI